MARFAVARYLDNGDLDPAFGDGGKATVAFADGEANAFALAVDRQDHVLLAGSVRPPAGSRFALTRHRPDGTLDPAFGDAGRVSLTFPSGRSFATSLAIDSDDRIVAAGGVYLDPDSESVFAVARLRPDGSADPSFGTDGRVTVAFAEGHGFATSVSIDLSGRIVAAGFVNAGVPGSVFALVRLLENGELDRRFGDDGRVLIQFQGADAAHAVAHDDRDRIVVAGQSGPGGGSDAAIARLRGDGSLDPTFGVHGRAYSDMGGRRGRAFGLALAPNDRIVLAGLAHRNLDQFGIVRLLPGGDHDQTFSSDGRALSGFFDTDGAQDAAVDEAGRVVATGYTGTAGEGTVFATARLNLDGTPDLTFGLNGQVFTDFVEGSVDRASGVGIDSDSRILVGGSIGHPRGWPLGHGRYKAGERLVKGIRGEGGVEVRAMVYYPALREGRNTPMGFGAPFPIVGFVHANRGAPPCPGAPTDETEDFLRVSTILRHLARWGYVVISSDASEASPGTAFQQGVLVGSLEYLIAENGRSGSPFHDKLRTAGVVLMGHSTGGGAALQVGGSTTLDVGAIATLVPSAPNAPASAIPTLVIGVSRDDGTFGGNAGALYAQADPPKHHVHIVGANHFGFTDDLCFGSDGAATISRDDQQRIAAAYLTAFLQQYVGGDASYTRVLDGSLPIESLEPFEIEVDAEV